MHVYWASKFGIRINTKQTRPDSKQFKIGKFRRIKKLFRPELLGFLRVGTFGKDFLI